MELMAPRRQGRQQNALRCRLPLRPADPARGEIHNSGEDRDTRPATLVGRLQRDPTGLAPVVFGPLHKS